MDLAFDVETYEKRGDYYEPILDGTGEHFLVGSITKEEGKSILFYDKKEMWDYILEEGRKARRSGHCVYAYAHNIKYDFYNIFRPEKDLVILAEYPFIAIYYVTTRKEVPKEKWEGYKKYLDLSKKSYRYSIKDTYVELDLKEEAVRFVDTMNLFRMALKKVGEMIGLEKMDLPKRLTKEDIHKEGIKRYVSRDTEILVKAVKMLKRKIKRDGINIKRLVTMNQIAISYLLNMMKKENTPIFTGTGNKIVQSKARRKVRKAYRGGRVEAWKTGITKGVSSIDVNSLYPYASTKIQFPDLNTEVFWNKPKREIWWDLLNKVGVCRAMMYNEENDLGYLPIRLPHLSYFPKKNSYMIGTWTNREILKALEEGYRLINIQFIITHEEINNPFKKIMNDLYNKRIDKSLDEFNKSFYKSVMNGGIGKFAQTKIGQEIVFDNIDKTLEYKKNNYDSLGGIRDDSRIIKFRKEHKKFNYKPYYCPIIPALITAEARTIMYDAYKDIGKERLIYSDTDNITFIGDRNNVPRHLKIGEGLGEYKIEFENVEFECWGRKSKRINDEIKASGVTKNSLREYDKKTGKVKYAKMQGLKKSKVGAFLIQEKDFREQEKNFHKQERELEEIKIFIDETILKDIREDHGDGKNKDDIFYFREDIKRANKQIMKGGKSLNTQKTLKSQGE